MARAAFPLVLQSPSTGAAIIGATATITKHVIGQSLGSGPAASIYTQEVGGSPLAGNQITTDNTGRWTQGQAANYAQYWLPEGTYDIVISGIGLTAYTITRELVSGSHVTTDGGALDYTAGTLAARPAATTVPAGAVYRSSDTGDISRTDGATWRGEAQFAQGTAAARPAAGIAGRQYYATDTGEWSEDNGGSWQSLIATRGAVNISASQSTSSTTYTTLSTPDQVTGIVLPPNGLISVWYQATWQESVNFGAAANIFLNGVPVQVGTTTGPLSTVPALIGGGTGNVNKNVSLTSTPVGLSSYDNGGATPFVGPYPGDATTGQVVGGTPGQVIYGSQASVMGLGGPCYIFAAAGTYTVSVQFKASAGSVTASNRKLWVEAKSFA